MNANLLSRMKLEHAMRQALGEQRLSVHYQPQVNRITGRIIGAEALIDGRILSLVPYHPHSLCRWLRSPAIS
jgi:FOG: EAL domain